MIMYKTVILSRERQTSIDDMFDNSDFTVKPDQPLDRLTKKTYFYKDPMFDTQCALDTSRVKVEMINLINMISDYLKEHNPNEEYISFKIPKKTGGMRSIDAPIECLKRMQSNVVNSLQRMDVLTHDAAWAYVKGRDVIGAVNEHQKNNSRWFLKIDLKNFFPSCTAKVIKNNLRVLYPFYFISDEIYDTFIDKLVSISFKDEVLPQGTPISPHLTNLVMVCVDHAIQHLLNNSWNFGLKKQRYVYTRYADDIIISAKESFDYKKLIDAIERWALADTPFEIKNEKTRYGSCAGRNWNLGIMYNKDRKITVGHKRKHQIKQMLYSFVKYNETWELDNLYTLQGQLSWLGNVEPDYYKGLMEYYQTKYHIDIKSTLVKRIKEYNT